MQSDSVRAALDSAVCQMWNSGIHPQTVLQKCQGEISAREILTSDENNDDDIWLCQLQLPVVLPVKLYQDGTATYCCIRK